jgi:hypothetical protein
VRTLRETSGTLAPRSRDATRWLLVGSVLALVPVLAVVPTPRLLGGCMIGVAPTVAVILDGLWFRARDATKGRTAELAGLVGLALAFCQLVRGPGESWLESRHHRNTSYRFATQAASFDDLRAEAGDAEPLVVRALGAAFFIPFALEDGGVPRRHRVLAETSHALVIRVDDRTIDLFSPREGSLLPVGEANLFRDMRSPFAAGDVIEGPGMTVTISDVVEGRVIAARYELDRSLDAVAFVHETRTIYERSSAPPIGFGVPLDAGATID